MPFTSDYASLTDGYIIPAGVGFIMMIVDSSYYNGNNSDYPSGAGPKNNIYRFYALNPNSLGADAEYSVQVASNGAASVKRHDDYDSDSWQYSWDDGLTFLGLPNSYKASYSADTNMPRYLYMRTPGAGNGGYVALDSEETDITPYSAYFGFMSPTTVGTLETQSISFSGYGETPDVVLYQSNAADKERFIFQLTKNNVQQDMMGIYFNQDASDKYVRNEDAIKMGTNGVNILWNHFQTANYAFNTIPFQGDSMRFQVNLITEETNGYALKAYKPFSNEYDLYITEGNTPQRTLMTDNYQIKSRGNVILWLDFIKKFRTITESENITSNAHITIITKEQSLYLAYLDNVKQIWLYTTSGKLVRDYSNIEPQIVIDNLIAGVYLLKVKIDDNIFTEKVVIK